MRACMTLPQYRRGEVSIEGVAVHLTPHETELVAILLTSAPNRIVDKMTFIEAIWPDPDLQPVTAPKIVDVLVMQVRKKGVPVTTVWGHGFFVPEEGRGGPFAPAPYFRLAA